MIASTMKKALEHLPHRLRYELFYQTARSLGVTGYVAEGRSGAFLGALSDQSVIRPYLTTHEWSANIVALISSYLRAQGGGTFIDIGANIGMITVPIGKLPGVRCIAIEPDPQNFRMLKANVAANSEADNVRLLNAAVADKHGTLRFTKSAYNSGDHRLSADGELSVTTVPLDSVEVAPGPLAIKIDTQGAEPLIFTGGHACLSRAGLVIAEFWPWGMARMGLKADAVLDFVRDSQRHGYLLQHDQPPPPAPLSNQALLSGLRAIVNDGTEFAQADLVLA